MDLSKFRASGDLSDIVIVVEGNENHLHRFPLFARSSFFESLARHNGCGEPQTPALKGNRLVLSLGRPCSCKRRERPVLF